ncbi:MAG: hypothetical protein AAF331_03035 [Pseudomonadota bacterium]
MKLATLIIAGTLAVTGCATGYQVDGFTGGQMPKWRSVDVLEIDASGNGYTSSSKLGKMALLRAAETAIEANYRYFIEIGSEDTGKSSTVNMPSTETTTYSGGYTSTGYNSTATTTFSNNSYDVYKPGANLVYRMYEDLPEGARPGQFHDAYEIYNRLGKKWVKKFEPKTPPA